MANGDSPQPWENVVPWDQQRKRLQMDLPQLLPPLSQAPQTFSKAPATPSIVPLSDSQPSPRLGLTPPAPKPLADEADPYGDVKALTDIQQRRQELQSTPVENQAPWYKKALGTLLSMSDNPGQRQLGLNLSRPGDVQRAKDLDQLAEQEKGVSERARIRQESVAAEKAGREDVAKTVTTDEGVFQYNPDSKRFDIKVGAAKKPAGMENIGQEEAEAVEEEVAKGTPRIDAIAKVKGSGQKPDTQTQNKERFQGIIGKVDAAGLPTDPRSLPQSLNSARQRGAITAEEHQAASGYLAANPTPSTTVQVQTTAAETKQEIKDANTYYRWTENGQIKTGKGGKVPKGIDAEPIGNDKDFAMHLREGTAANIVQQSLNRVAKDVDEHPELFDNAAARNIMATTLEQIDRASAGILIAGTGGSIPLPSGMGDMINTALQNKALDDKTARALKDYIADYKAMKDKGIVQQMEMQGGRIGRGSAQVFSAIVDQIPNGKTADSTEARRQIKNMQDTQDSLMRQYRDEGKEKPYQMKQQAGGSHDFTYQGVRYQGVPDAIYQKYKVRPGFSEP